MDKELYKKAIDATQKAYNEFQALFESAKNDSEEVREMIDDAVFSIDMALYRVRDLCE